MTHAPAPTLTTSWRSAQSAARQHWKQLVTLSRPGQWAKNVLVLAAPAAAGALDQGRVVARTGLLVLAFTAASVAVYAANDVLDADRDRAHPVKRRRPVASGALHPRAALAWGTGAAAAALITATAVSWGAVAVIATYLTLSAAYVLRLKHVAVLDIVVVAAGFVLRALAGAVGNGIPVSSWFLLVSLFGALYLVTAKRAAESQREGANLARDVLTQYPQQWLQQVVGVALTGALLSYAMWAFQDVGTDVFTPVVALSVAPFLVALLRYGLLVSYGHGESPELMVRKDRPLLVAGLLWTLMLTAGIYGA